MYAERNKIHILPGVLLMVIVIMVFPIAGCGNKSKPMSIILNVDTGDTIRVTLDTQEGHSVDVSTVSVGTDEITVLEISDSDGGMPLRGTFVSQNKYSEYYNTAYTDTRSTVLDTGERSGVSYTLYTFDMDGKPYTEYIGWVKGSNVGIVLESKMLGREDTENLIGMLSFEVEKTMQVNGEYVYEPMVGASADSVQTSSQQPVDEYETVQDDAQNITSDVPETVPTAGDAGSTGGDVTPETQDVQDDNPAQVEKTDWSTMLVKIDGVEYSFPYSLRTLQANGWTFNIEDYLEEGQTEYILEEGEYTYSTTLLSNEQYGSGAGSAEIYVGFKNFTQEPKNILDCGIWAIEVSGVYGTMPVKKCPDVELPGGVKFGMTMDEIKAVYGEPDEVDDNDYYVKLEYVKDYSRQMDLYVYTGKDGGAEGLLDIEFRNYE